MCEVLESHANKGGFIDEETNSDAILFQEGRCD
jgi:hypothetical protein